MSLENSAFPTIDGSTVTDEAVQRKHVETALNVKGGPYAMLALASDAARVPAVEPSGEPLLELLAARRFDSERQQALRDAVSAIQSRLAGAEVGQLSLGPMALQAGRLSLAAPGAGSGDVSLVESEDPSGRTKSTERGHP